jgi:hypothetical protein
VRWAWDWEGTSSLNLVALSPSGCVATISADTRVQFKTGERWVARSEVPLAGKQSQALAGRVKPSFKHQIVQQRATGPTVAWGLALTRSDGNAGLLFTSSGQGLQKLNRSHLYDRAASHKRVDRTMGQP